MDQDDPLGSSGILHIRDVKVEKKAERFVQNRNKCINLHLKRINIHNAKQE